MTKQTWIFVGIFSALAAIGFIVFSSWERSQAVSKLESELAEVRGAAEKAALEATQAKEKLSETQTRIGELEREKEAVVQTQKGLEDQMRAALQSKDVVISELQGKLTVTILDRILFDSGEATLKPEGERVLQEIANVLAKYPNRQIHVIGHTDNVPIRASSWSRHPTNWELSTARATAAVRFLQEKAGVDPRRLGAVGYGEHHPVADNSTPEGRSKNRRIALVVLPEELAAADLPTKPASPNQ